MPEKLFRNMLDGVEQETYAVLSTAHVTLDDSRLLTELLRNGSPFPEGILFWEHTQGGRGWRIKMSSDAEDDGMAGEMVAHLEATGFSRAFCELMRAALMSVYAGIVFDRDADVYYHLSSFDW